VHLCPFIPLQICLCFVLPYLDIQFQVTTQLPRFLSHDPRDRLQKSIRSEAGEGRGVRAGGLPTEPPNRPRQLPSDRFKRRAGGTVARQQAEILMDGTRKRLRFIACQRGSSARTFTVNKMNRFALQQLDITASREHQYEHPEIYRKLFLQINQRFS